MRVLIVDDEPYVLQHLGTELREQKCQVETATSIAEAKKLIAAHKFDYAVIDLYLDVTSGYGGIDVYRQAKKAGIQSIILSGYPVDQVEEYLNRASAQPVSEQFIKEIKANYVYKGEPNNYIVAIFRKLGVEDNVSGWFGNYHALLIAVQDYDCREIHKLQYPVHDAAKLRRVLTSDYSFPEENTTVMANPKRNEVLSQLYDLSNTLTFDDNLLIFFAGHGYWDERREQGYWLPGDAQLDSPANWISNGDIRDFVRGIRTQHTLVVSDACFSGAILRTRRASTDSKTIDEKYRIVSRRVIASSSPKQVVPDRSVFLDYLIECLKQNAEPHLYAEKLYVATCDRFVAANLSQQNPVYGSIQFAGDEVGGDFIFNRT